MPPARHRAPAPWRRPLGKSLLWCEAISVGEKSQGGCVGSWGQPLTSAPTAAQTPGGASQPLSWLPPYFGPAIATCPHLAVPLTRGFGDSFREDEPQRGGMGHGGAGQALSSLGLVPQHLQHQHCLHPLAAKRPSTGISPVQKFTECLPLCGNALWWPRDAIGQEQLPSAFSTTSGH